MPSVFVEQGPLGRFHHKVQDLRLLLEQEVDLLHSHIHPHRLHYWYLLQGYTM